MFQLSIESFNNLIFYNLHTKNLSALVEFKMRRKRGSHGSLGHHSSHRRGPWFIVSAVEIVRGSLTLWDVLSVWSLYTVTADLRSYGVDACKTGLTRSRVGSGFSRFTPYDTDISTERQIDRWHWILILWILQERGECRSGVCCSIDLKFES